MKRDRRTFLKMSGAVAAGAAGTATRLPAHANEHRTPKADPDGVLRRQPFVLLKYVTNEEDPHSSLLSAQAEIGQVFLCSFWDRSEQPGSSSLWKCIARGAGQRTGSPRYVERVGIVIEGISASYVMIPQGGQLDPRQLGVLCDGATTGQESAMDLVIRLARAAGLALVGHGEYLCPSRSTDIGVVNVDFSRLKFRGRPAYDGIVVNLGADGRNSEAFTRKAFVWGDGSSDFSRVSRATGIRVPNDNSALSTYEGDVAYLGVGYEIFGNTEKSIHRVHAVYCDLAVKVSDAVPARNGSPDSNHVILHAEDCRRWLDIGADSSGYYELYVENQHNDGSGRPAIRIGNGKGVTLAGTIRGQNGGNAVSGGDSIQTDRKEGVDTLQFDDLRFIHGYGTALHIKSPVRRLAGQLLVKGFKNGRDPARENAWVPCPAVWIEKAVEAGACHIAVVGCHNREGVRIGSAEQAPINCDFNFSIEMGDSLPASERGPFPKHSMALVVEAMTAGSVTLHQCLGGIAILDGAKGITLNIPASFLNSGYTITKSAAATAYVRVRGATLSSTLKKLPWLFDGIYVEAVADADFKPALRVNGEWMIFDGRRMQ
jgi:hypothetical protein